MLEVLVASLYWQLTPYWSEIYDRIYELRLKQAVADTKVKKNLAAIWVLKLNL